MARAKDALTPGPALEGVLRRGVPPLVALVGDENYLKEEGLEQVREALGADGETEAIVGPRNDTESAAFDPARVFDALRTGLLFGGTRLVAVRRADRFVSDAAEPLGRLFESPVTGAVLVLFLRKLDGRTRLARALAKTGLRVECARLYDRPAPWMQGKVPDHDHELSRWTQARARRVGKRMSLQVAHVLTEHTGNDLGRIAGAVDALALFVGERPEIDAAALSEVIGGTGEQTMFRICDEILEGDARKALPTLETTFRAGLEMQGKAVLDPHAIAIILVSQLSRRLRALLSARRAFEAGGRPEEVLRDHGPSQRGLQPRFAREVGRYDAATLGMALKELLRLERILKSWGKDTPVALLLEAYVADLCRRPRPRRPFSIPDRGRGGRRWG